MSTAQSARISIVLYSLGVTAFVIVFLALSQVLGMRFDYSKQENFRLIDIVLPTFLAYLGSASHFVFNSNSGREISDRNSSLLKILIHGPFLIFIIFWSSLFYVHYKTHLPIADDAPRVDPLTFDTLSRYLSVALGLLAATVSVVSSYLFGSPPAPKINSIKRKDARMRYFFYIITALFCSGTASGDELIVKWQDIKIHYSDFSFP